MKKSQSTASKRAKQTRYLSQAIQLEEAVNPHIVHSTMIMISLALLMFIGWSSLTNINEVARTPGEIVPHGYQQTVQHLEGGIVKAIKVYEGDVVNAGDTLLILDNASIQEDLERAEIKQLNLEMQAERLRAYIEKRQPNFTVFTSAPAAMVADQTQFFEGMRSAREKEKALMADEIQDKKQRLLSLKSKLKTAEENAIITNKIYTKRKSLNQKGYTSDMQILEDKRALNIANGDTNTLKNELLLAATDIETAKDRLASLSARQQDEIFERLSSISSEKAQNTEIIQKMQERIGRMNIRAPSHGLVKGLNINTIGAIVKSGETIMEIIPLDKRLEVAVKISPQDIGHLKIGQPVQVKFSTFDFSRYGSVQGTLDHISATTFAGDQGNRHYKGRVLLSQSHVGNNPDNAIMPGMTVMADVITGDKTILQYMLKPIHISLKTAFTER